MKILITGNEGFVGRNFEQYLTKHPKYRKAEIVGCDIKSKKDCRELFRKDKTVYDLVIHLAAIVGGREMIEKEPIAVATDLAIDSDLFNWVVKTKQPRVIYFSSSAAYPTKLQESKYRLKESDIDLDNITNADMTYGWTKLTGEYMAKFARTEGSKIYIARPFSGYGNDQDLTYPFPSFIRRALLREDPFTVWGTGKQVRDFIHINDIVAASMKMVEEDFEGPINMGLGIPTSFIELAKLVSKEVDYKPRIKCDNTKPVGVSYRCCNPKNFFAFYTPKIDLAEGINRATVAMRKELRHEHNIKNK